MRILVFSARAHDRQFLAQAAAAGGGDHALHFHPAALDPHTARLAQGCEAVCLFVNDLADAAALGELAAVGVRFIALRCSGYNNVDLAAAARLGIAVGHVPAYSPAAVAEHAFALILTLDRQTHRAYARVREGNFSIEGLLGFDLEGKTLGIVGTGQIGLAAARIAAGFGLELLGVDPMPAVRFTELGGRYVGWEELCARSDIVSLHCPLTEDTRHLVDAAALARMQRGVMLINTCRGAVIDTRAVIAALKTGHIGALGIDVYEEEAGLFFEDRSGQILQDDIFARLLTFPNVLITGHQGYFTREALQTIAATTIANCDGFAAHGCARHPVPLPPDAPA